MKKFFLLLVILSVTAFTVQAQDAAKEAAKEVKQEVKQEVKELKEGTNLYEDEDGNMIETAKPIFQFAKETHDFGELDEGPKYDYEFSFKNIGLEPLVITGVKASCGCTTPEWPKQPILPGEDAAIKVIYNTKGRLNNFNKAITITSNSITPTKRLYIKGKVNPSTPDQPVKPKSMIEAGDQ